MSRRRAYRDDDKPGLGAENLAKIKRRAEAIMAAIDDSPPAWRGLVNDYHEDRVIPLGRAGLSPDEIRIILERQYGRPI